MFFYNSWYKKFCVFIGAVTYWPCWGRKRWERALGHRGHVSVLRRRRLYHQHRGHVWLMTMLMMLIHHCWTLPPLTVPHYCYQYNQQIIVFYTLQIHHKYNLYFIVSVDVSATSATFFKTVWKVATPGEQLLWRRQQRLPKRKQKTIKERL